MPKKINVAIIGLDNAASALIQDIKCYKIRSGKSGLTSSTPAGYNISHIELVAYFNSTKAEILRYLI